MDRRLGENIFLNASYNILSILVPFVTAPYLGRVLGAANIGEYTYVYSVASYFVMFGLLGINNYGTREIAKVRDDREKRSKTFWEIYYMQCLTGAIALLSYLLYAITISKSSGIGCNVMAFYVATSAIDCVWYCSGVEKFGDIVARNAAIKFVNLICIFTFVHQSTDLGLYFIIMALSYLLSATLLWPLVLKEVDFYRPDWSSLKKHLKPNFFLFVPAIAASIYQIMDKVMIGAIASKSQLAYYEYADKIINIPNIIFGSIGAVMLSRMSHVLEHNRNQFQRLISYSIDLSFLISVGFAFGAFSIGNELVAIYYGPNFIASSSILKILSPIVILYGWNNVLRMQYIIPKNLNSIYISSTVAGAAINLLLNFIFIPRFGAEGATIGTIAAQCAITFFYTFQIRANLPFRQFFINNVVLFVIGLFMSSIIFMIQRMHTVSVTGLIIDIFIGMVIYCGLCLVYGRYNKHHLLNQIYLLLFRR